ncbi:hypothetical protein J577_1432 [Acinetobacter sp. 263903-1]|nr:hypothetical protein J577_1432 [Acinetobacter sp. 263903-1]
MDVFLLKQKTTYLGNILTSQKNAKKSCKATDNINHLR